MSDLNELSALKIEREPERRGGRWVGWLVVLLLLGGGGYAGYWFLTRVRPLEVEIAAVTERAAGAQAAVLNASGYVTARRRATVSSKVTGKVIEVNVEEGMAVKEGQVLARLDDTSYQASLNLAMAQAEAARRNVNELQVRLAEAKVTYGRLASLLKDGIVTQADVDASKATIDSYDARILATRESIRVAERSIELEQTSLDNTIIRAPFSGVAISKDAQPGEMVSPVSAGGGFTRTGICTIVDMKSLEIEVDVNESYIGRVKPGQGVSAVLDAYPEWPIPGHVITTVPTADRQKATVLVRIAFEKLDPRILPDMGIKVTFLGDAKANASLAATRPVTLVPKNAVKTQGSESFVFVVVGDTADRRVVRTGGTDGDRVEVVGSVAAGDRVIVSPPTILVNGAKVKAK